MIKYITILSLTVILASCLFRTDNTELKLHEQRKLLKEFALWQCIRYTGSYTDENDISGGDAMEFTNYGIETFEIIDSIAKEYMAHYYMSLKNEGKNMKLKYCLKFYESEKLDSIVKSFDGDILDVITSDCF